MDTYAIQIMLSGEKWHWLEDSDFGFGLTASRNLNHDTVLFDSKADCNNFIANCQVKQGSEIMVLHEFGNDLSEEILSVRVVKIEALEV